jgi:hypothetical protein
VLNWRYGLSATTRRWKQAEVRQMKNMPFRGMTQDRTAPRFDICAMVAEREAERYGLQVQHMNEMMVRVLFAFPMKNPVTNCQRAISGCSYLEHPFSPGQACEPMLRTST